MHPPHGLVPAACLVLEYIRVTTRYLAGHSPRTHWVPELKCHKGLSAAAGTSAALARWLGPVQSDVPKHECGLSQTYLKRVCKPDISFLQLDYA